MRRIAIILFFVFLTTQIRTAHAQSGADLTQGLVAYWSLDESSGVRYDAHGGYDLTDFNTVPQVAGLVGYAASFNDVYGVIPDERLAVPFAGLDGAAEWTISLWVYSYYFDETFVDIGGLVRIKSGGGNPVNDMRVIFENGSYLTSAPVSRETWRHVTVVYNAGTVQIYRDGQLQSSTVNGSIPTVMGTGGMLNLGTAPYTLDAFLGWLDEVGIWARALTADEVADVYNGGAGMAYTDILATAGAGVLQVNVTDVYGNPFPLDKVGRMDPGGYTAICTHCSGGYTTLDNSEPWGYHGGYVNMVITQAQVLSYTITPFAVVQVGVNPQPDLFVTWEYWPTGTHTINLVMTPTAVTTQAGLAYPTLVAPPDLSDLGLSNPQDDQGVEGISLAYAEGEVPPIAMRRATDPRYAGLAGTMPRFAADYPIWLGHAENVVRLINMGNALWILAAVSMAGLIVGWAVRELRNPK